MALTKNYTKIKIYAHSENDVIEKEIEYKNAYIQITNIKGDKNNIKLDVTVYENEEKDKIIDEIYYNFNPSVDENSENFIKQGYEYLKTLEKYQDAIDC